VDSSNYGSGRERGTESRYEMDGFWPALCFQEVRLTSRVWVMAAFSLGKCLERAPKPPNDRGPAHHIIHRLSTRCNAIPQRV
jgi:hypothetical protein